MGIWKKYPRVESCAYGTCENQKTCRDAEADHLRQGYGGQAARKGGDEAAYEEGRLRTATAFT